MKERTFKRDKKHPKALDHDLIIEMYEGGYGIHEIMEATGAGSHKTIRSILKEHRKSTVRPGIDVPKARALANAGWSVEKIAEEFGRNFTEEEIRKALTRQKGTIGNGI